jgi:macrolide transport system ATP-binding/permease protein
MFFARFMRANKEREMREELELHLQREIDSLTAQGLPENEARNTAARLFGNSTAVAEQCHDYQHIAWLENLGRDIVYGLKGLRRTPAFCAVATLSLALGIGVNAAVFSVIYVFLLEPLDVPRSDRLAALRVERPAALMHGLIPANSYGFSFQAFDHFRRENRAFSGLFATGDASFLFRTREGNRTVPGAWVSGDYFSVLKQQSQQGRLLTRGDDKPGGGSAGLVAVISDAFWSGTFGRDPKVIGKTIRLNDHDVTLIGVTS